MLETDQQVKHLNAVFAATLDAVVVSSAQGVIELFNPAAEQMFGYHSEEVLGMNINILMPMPDSVNHQLYMDRYIETGQARIPRKGREVVAKRRNGETFFADIAISDVILNGRMIFTAIIRDISVRKQHEQKIIQLAFFDQETGLPNNYYLADKLESLLIEQQNNNYLISLYLGDLSDYINIFGVQSVKDIITALAQTLKNKLPRQSLITRCGLRHLKILYVGSDDEHVTDERLAKQLQTHFRQPLPINNNHIFLNTTFGVIKIIPEYHTVKLLLDNVDIALHMAKNHLVNNYQIFKEEFIDTLHRRALIVQKLYNAVNELPFELYLQPQVSLKNQQIIGVEALIRWQDSDALWIPPGKFIPIAETIGLIKDITLWTLKKACAIVNGWQAVTEQQYQIAVNISAQVICSATFVHDIVTLLAETNINPNRLEFEITETALMLSIDAAVNTVRELSRLGISISIDDFGTGLSSLAYLKLFNINRLKIDKSFIVNVQSNENDRAMLAAIINLGHELNYQVVCEGVEQKAQLDLLIELGCDEIQGYYFARPMPHTEFLRFAQNFNFQQYL